MLTLDLSHDDALDADASMLLQSVRWTDPYLRMPPSDKLNRLPAISAADGVLYMFLCYDDDQFWNDAGPDVHRAAMMEAVELTHQLNARGQYLSASPLQPDSTASSVRIRDDLRIVAEGPFAETREILGGYYLMLANVLKQAILVAAQHSGARVGTVEVRRVFELPALAQLSRHILHSATHGSCGFARRFAIPSFRFAARLFL